MAQNGTVAFVEKLPNCNFCEEEKPAEFDFRTHTGSWAYGCMDHYAAHRLHKTLGVGRGQRLEVRK